MSVSLPLNNMVRNKRRHLIAALRGQILKGVFGPGSRLPTIDKMVEEHAVSRATLQHVLDQLKQDGYIVTDGRRGTFVSQRPPHLSRYALVSTREGSPSNRFWVSLVREAALLDEAQGKQCKIYHFVDGYPDNPVCQELAEDIESHRVAGVIFSDMSKPLADSPLVRQEVVPKVVFSNNATPTRVLRMGPNGKSFLDKSLQWLAHRKRQRIAVISVPRHPLCEQYPRAIVEHGMTTRDCWHLPVSGDHFEGAFPITKLLMDGDPAQRPDGLIVTDDNLAEHVLKALVHSNISIPQDMDVVAHCNWTLPVEDIVPVRRLGYDIRELLQISIRTIDAQRRGEEMPDWQTLPALFEEELGLKTEVSLSHNPAFQSNFVAGNW